MKPATVLMTIPKKKNDATTYTAEWAEKIYKVAKSLGYNAIVLRGKETTYNNVTDAIQKYHPEVFIHTGHGCRSHINGQDECIVTRKYSINELKIMEPSKLDWLLNPVKLGSGCGKDICKLEKDLCMPLCFNPTNIDLLNGSIIISNACHSSSQLGRCAIAMKIKSFVGYDDLLLFPADDMRSQDLFGDLHVMLAKNILMGQSIGEAYNDVMTFEDSLIREYKSVKWLGLPLLWDHIHRELLGDPNATIY
jgi:hypothetical protein